MGARAALAGEAPTTCPYDGSTSILEDYKAHWWHKGYRRTEG